MDEKMLSIAILLVFSLHFKTFIKKEKSVYHCLSKYVLTL